VATDLSKEMLEASRTLWKDKRYRNQIYPAKMFQQYAPRYLGFEVSQLWENENDPPDFFIRVNDTEISLEVTTFFEEVIRQKNSFFEMLEFILRPIIDASLPLLPNGLYMFYFFPGSLQATENPNFSVDIPDFGPRVSRDELSKQLSEKLPAKLRELTSNFNLGHESPGDALSITDTKGNSVGEIRISRYGSTEKSYILWPQKMIRYTPWSEVELRDAIQYAIDQKEEKYLKKNPSELSGQPWWLLISDIYNDFGTNRTQFDIAAMEVRLRFFQRVFLIQDILKDYEIIEFRGSSKKITSDEPDK